MNIMVRVASAQARAQIKQLERELQIMERQLKRSGSAGASFNGSLHSNTLGKWGSQLQWAGRQLQYNFTLPILAAGGAALKFQLDNERAMTGVIKVYGDGSDVFNRLTRTEIPALGRAFEALSNQFGVNQSKVIEIAADWAAAGASGIALARSVRLTLETMILGEMDAVEATQALIAIQAQYGLSIKELAQVIDTLNMVENQTGITMEGLIQGFARAAGVARSAGIDTQHLAAMLAALVPAAGSAAQAGNAIKTMISRLLAPTKEAAEVLGLMGVNVKELSWQSLNGVQRLELLATKFKDLDDAQKAVVSSVIASRFQINKFDVLMRDLVNTHGYYQRALESTSDAQKNFRQRVRELNTVLESNPQRLKQIWTILQNAMADVIQPLIPMLLHLAGFVARLATSFSNLDPTVQRFIVLAALALAAVGPLVRYMGAFSVLGSKLGPVFKFLLGPLGSLVVTLFKLVRIPWGLLTTGFGALLGGLMKVVLLAKGPISLLRTVIVGGIRGIIPLVARGAMAIGSALLGPWGLAIAAVLALLYVFRDKISSFFSSLVDVVVSAFWRLPAGVRDAFFAVVRVIQQAAMKVYELFSYLNPFARHSPSLVDSVVAGMAVIRKEFAGVANVGSVLDSVAADLKAFRAILDSIGGKFADDRLDVAKAIPGALPLFDKLVSKLKVLANLLAQQENLVTRQQAVVDQWKAALDAANKSLDLQQDKLQRLQDQAAALNAEMQAHQDALEAFANAPIEGMKEMGDAIFANEMAQKELRLEMLRWEQVNGSIDDLRNRLAGLQGDIETMAAEASELRQAGAGADILGPIEAQIAALEQQKTVMEQTLAASPMAALQAEMEELQRQGEILDLENALQFDPLTRQVDELTNSMKELPFDQIIAGIQAEQAAMATLQPQLDAANAAVEKQEQVVKAAQAARDSIQATYDREQDKLNALKETYDAIADSVRDVEAALREMSSAAAEAAAKKDKMSAGAENFLAAEGANFPEVGGAASIGREGGLGDQSKLIDEFTRGLAADTAKLFGSFDLFGPIKEKWNQVWSWITSRVEPIIGGVADAIRGSLANTGLGEGFLKVFGVVWDVLQTVGEWIGKIFNLFAPDLKRYGGALVDAFGTIKARIWPQLVKFKELVGPIGEAIHNLWRTVKPILIVLGLAVLAAFKVWYSVYTNIIGPVLNLIIGLISRALQIIRGILQVVMGLINGDWSLAWEGIKNIVMGVFGAIWDIIRGAVQIIWGVIKGLVEGIVGFFTWLYDTLVGHSIIPDMMKAIVGWFEFLTAPIRAAWNAIWTAIKWAWNNIAKPFFIAVGDYIKFWAAVFTWIWNNVIKPAWDKIWSALKYAWDNFGLPLFAAIKESIKTWAGIFKWVWDNIIKPAWDALKTGLKYVWDHGIKPIFDTFTKAIGAIGDTFTAMKEKIKDIFDRVKEIIKAAVDWIADKLEKIAGPLKSLIDGIGKVGGAVGGVVSKIPGFARGGVTAGPAIIGEGRRAYPEYVIPTDPAFRSNAIALLVSAMGSMGPGTLKSVLTAASSGAAMPRYASGGVLLAASATADGASRRNSEVLSRGGYSNETTINIYGDLAFPNITSGDDAKNFVDNLKVLVND